MNHFFAILLVILLSFSNIVPISLALSVKNGENAVISSEKLIYPDGTDFVQLKSIIDSTFLLSNTSSRSYGRSCIYSGKFCPNYRYTSVVEKAIKFIILKTYTGNEDFYNTLFKQTSSYNSSDASTVNSVIDNVPRGSTFADWKKLGFGSSIDGQLLGASFGVNFTENANSSSMLSAIERKISDIKRMKCQKGGGKDCYSNELSNIYLPTPEELYKETIFLNGSSVTIETLRDEIEYILQQGELPQLRFDIDISKYQPKSRLEIYRNSSDSGFDFSGATPIELQLLFPDGNIDIPALNIEWASYEGKKQVFQRLQVYKDTISTLNSTERIAKFKQEIQTFSKDKVSSKEGSVITILSSQFPIWLTEIEQYESSLGYILRYKKNSYTLEEAKALLDKKVEIGPSNVVVMRSGPGPTSRLPCSSEGLSYLTRSQCAAAMSNMKDIATALGAYYSDTERFPDTIDQLNQNYLPRGRGDFDKYFTYKGINNADNYPDYEITYIGNIGEGVESSGPMKRDYLALMSGSTFPEIPSIFAHIPSDSMVLYVRNPANLLDILNQKSNTSQKLSGLDVSENIRMFVKSFFEIDNFQQIEKNLKHEMAIVVNNLDATAPDIVIVLSEYDKDVLSPTAKAHVVGSTNGFIFVASSKASLERFINLTIQKSLKNAPDFQYVWWKQSALIQDALVYVGDEFFANLLTLETYLTHYRKYRDYARLTALQELFWAYSDAFGKSPTQLSELVGPGFSTLTGETLGEYSIEDGLVKHRHIGTLKSLRTIPESGYNLSKISRSEIEDFKYSVLKYRDVWQNALDPMGIVLNRYGDGLEMDFFMTPVPILEGELGIMQLVFENITKTSLEFVSNKNIRMGILSMVFGVDLQKFQSKVQSLEDFKGGLEEFNSTVLDGKNILDFLGGEFAFTLGNLDPDIFEGWNVDKVDAYISVQVKSEEKGKELIDILRKKIVSEFSYGTESEVAKLIAKPLIEDYKNKKIYYVDDVPVPFLGKIGFSYAFVEDFFVLGLNRTTIKNIIDISQTGDTWKSHVVTQDVLAPDTAIAVLFDGVRSSDVLRSMYLNNQRVLSSVINEIVSPTEVQTLLSQYYASTERSRRLGKEIIPFSYTLSAMTISGDTAGISARIDKNKALGFSGLVLQSFQDIQSSSGFPQEIFSPSGIPVEQLIVKEYFSDLLSVIVASQLDQVFVGTESLLRNVTFGLSYGDDEIGFKFRIFRNSDKAGDVLPGYSRDMLVILGIVLILGLIGGTTYIIYKRKKSDGSMDPMNPMSTTSPVPPDII